MRVTLFITCLVDLFNPDTGVATTRLLRDGGAEVSCPLDQTCCGQPAWNAGFAADAAKVARTSLAALEADLAAGSEAVVVPAGSCATMIKVFWPECFELAGDSDAAARARAVGERTSDLASFLAAQPTSPAPASPSPAHGTASAGDLVDADGRPSVVYHHSCHMLRELHVRDAPLDLLRDAGFAVAEWPEAERCCGFGGLFSMKLPETSVAMADDKLAGIPATADVLVGSDGSCLLHLESRLRRAAELAQARGDAPHVPQVRHLAEVLADAMGGVAAVGDARRGTAR